nr:MAG TPA: hypothetical protein [Caudoviricetes sp.]
MSSKNEILLADYLYKEKVATPANPCPTKDDIDQYASDIIEKYRHAIKFIEDELSRFKNTSLIDRIRNKCIESMVNETMDFLSTANIYQNITQPTISLATIFPTESVTTYSVGINKTEINTLDEVEELLGQIGTVLDFDKPGDHRREEMIMEPVEIKLKEDDETPAFVLQPEQIVTENIPTRIKVVFTVSF